MFAYCDPKTGDILFAPAKPRNRLIIAEHSNLEVLQTALRECGAHDRVEFKDGEQIGNTKLAVPWYSTAKYPEEEAEYVKRFAVRIREWFGSGATLQ